MLILSIPCLIFIGIQAVDHFSDCHEFHGIRLPDDGSQPPDSGSEHSFSSAQDQLGLNDGDNEASDIDPPATAPSVLVPDYQRLISMRVDLLRGELDPDSEDYADLERVHAMAQSLSLTDSATDIQGVLLKWIRLAVSLSSHPNLNVRLLALIMIQYLFRGFLTDFTASGTDPATLLHELLGFAFPENITVELKMVLEAMNPGSMSVRNIRDETLIVAAFRAFPHNDLMLQMFLHHASDSDMAMAMPAVLPHLQEEPGRWTQLFQNSIHDRLLALNYDLVAFLDELNIQAETRRRRIEIEIRIRELFYRGDFVRACLYFLVPGVLITSPNGVGLSEEDLPEQYCQMMGMSGAQRDFTNWTISLIVSGDITAADVFAYCRTPQDLPELIDILSEYHDIVSQDGCIPRSNVAHVDNLAEFLKLLLYYVDVHVDQILDVDTASVTIPILLRCVVPVCDLDAPRVYKRIVDAAMDVGGPLRTNLLRIVLYLARLHYDTPILIDTWTATFCRQDVLAVSDIWPDLISTVRQILNVLDSDEFLDPATRSLAALISHPELRAEIETFGEVPATDIQLQIKECLESLTLPLRSDILLAVDDDPSLTPIFQLDLHRDMIDYLIAYFARNYSHWIRAYNLIPATTSEIPETAEDCSLCLQPQCTADQFPTGPDPGQYTHRTLCGHYFHFSCILSWLRARTDCPLCDAELYNLMAAISYARRHPFRC